MARTNNSSLSKCNRRSGLLLRLSPSSHFSVHLLRLFLSDLLPAACSYRDTRYSKRQVARRTTSLRYVPISNPPAVSAPYRSRRPRPARRGNPARPCQCRSPKLKGSISEGSNHSNFSNQSSVKFLSKFRNFC